ncbi:MAG: hypothetical protein ACI8ZV_001851 [Chitinophagales bacterium]|jgi:hypothetical protein
MTKDQRTQIEAAAFRGLMKHLQERSDVQNIDLMNLAGFCRNCMSKWYAAEAQNQGLDMDYNAAQTEVYGMTVGEWKTNYQTKASDEQMQRFNDTKPHHAKISGH